MHACEDGVGGEDASWGVLKKGVLGRAIGVDGG
jgi:hypothetical protein